jgi:hypothetical protein
LKFKSKQITQILAENELEQENKNAYKYTLTTLLPSSASQDRIFSDFTKSHNGLENSILISVPENVIQNMERI